MPGLPGCLSGRTLQGRKNFWLQEDHVYSSGEFDQVAFPLGVDAVSHVLRLVHSLPGFSLCARTWHQLSFDELPTYCFFDGFWAVDERSRQDFVEYPLCHDAFVPSHSSNHRSNDASTKSRIGFSSDCFLIASPAWTISAGSIMAAWASGWCICRNSEFSLRKRTTS
jgi:hypothetical protein